jgi:hypothetical protein
VIGVDSNVLLRYLLQDDEGQCTVANRFFEARTRDDQGAEPIGEATIQHGALLSAAEQPKSKLSRAEQGPIRASLKSRSITSSWWRPGG